MDDKPAVADDELLAETDDDILQRKASSRQGASSDAKASRYWWVWVVVAVFLGVLAGSYIANANRPAVTAATPAATDQATAATPTVDPKVRIPELQAEIAKDPNNTDARLELGVLLYSEDPPDLAGATEQFKKVTEIDPNNENAWYNLGFCYLGLDTPDCADAMDAWNTVTRLDPTGDNAAQIQSHMVGLMPSVCPSYVGVTAAPSVATSTPGG